MHVHSEWSHDGHDSLASVAKFAVREQLRYVFLTDHAEDFDAARFASYLGECKAHSTTEHQLVPGLEFRFASYPGLHLLAVGLHQWMSPETPEDFGRQGTASGAFLAMAHPLLTNYQAPDTVLRQLHGIEVWNARYNTRYLPDGKAIEFWLDAQRKWPHLIATAGTDQHRLEVEGKTRLQLPLGREPLLALKEGAFRNQGLTLTFGSRPRWGGSARLKVLEWLRITVERGKRWRNRRVRRARYPTSSR